MKVIESARCKEKWTPKIYANAPHEAGQYRMSCFTLINLTTRCQGSLCIANLIQHRAPLLLSLFAALRDLLDIYWSRRTGKVLFSGSMVSASSSRAGSVDIPRWSSQRSTHPLGQRDLYAKKNCLLSQSSRFATWRRRRYLAARGKVLALG